MPSFVTQVGLPQVYRPYGDSYFCQTTGKLKSLSGEAYGSLDQLLQDDQDQQQQQTQQQEVRRQAGQLLMWGSLNRATRFLQCESLHQVVMSCASRCACIV